VRKDTFWLRMVSIASTALAEAGAMSPRRRWPVRYRADSARRSGRRLTLVPLIVVPAAAAGLPVAPRAAAEARRREEASHADR
jgi:hypothetical protein